MFGPESNPLRIQTQATAMFKVQPISKETIKPSSPTPSHLRFTYLSILDQIKPPIYIQTLVFYGAGDHRRGNGRVTQLKESLSKTLTHFYPLAGRIKNPTIPTLECTDEGVDFFETRVEGDLEAILVDPPIKELSQLLPYSDPLLQSQQPLLAIQLNEFVDGGGCVIGVCISHQVTDADSMTMFLNAWADVANGRQLSRPPRFDVMPSLFPPATTHIRQKPWLFQPFLVPRRFVIKSPAIEKLRGDAECCRTQFPTRVEAVTTLLWRCLVRTTAEGKDPSLKPLAAQSVCLRKRLMAEKVLQDDQVAAESLFGNIVTSVLMTGESIDQVCEKKVQGLLEKKLREAIKKAGEEQYVKETTARVQSDTLMKIMIEAGYDPEIWVFSSWCRFPIYKIDFGWGEPVWFANGWQGMRNLVILMDARDGDGMEVCIWMNEKEMGWFEEDPEILRLTSPTS